MDDPAPLEYIAGNDVMLIVSAILIGFAVVGIFASVEEIAFRLRRHRYWRARDESRRSKWTKNPRTKP